MELLAKFVCYTIVVVILLLIIWLDAETLLKDINDFFRDKEDDDN